MTSRISSHGYDKIKKLPTHIYYDISIVNNDPTGIRPAIDCSFSENRAAPYLSKPDEYHMSVIRFQLDTEGNLPLFIPYAQLGQNNVNLLIYTVTLSYTYLGTAYDAQVNLLYVPQNSQASPAPPVVNQDNTSQYYWIYSYQQFVNMINTAFATSYALLNIAVNAAGGDLPIGSVAPFMSLNAQTNLFSLYADTTYDITNGNHISIYANQPLFNHVGAMDRIQYSTYVNGKAYQYKIYNVNGLNTVTIPVGGINYYQMTQSYSTTAIMCPIKSIAFKSNQLPIIQNIISSNTGQFNSDTLDQSGGYNANISPNITDFIANITNGTEYLPLLIYSPASEYRLVDMISDTPLTSMDIRVFWIDQFGVNYPLKLLSGSCQIKILFRLKEYNNL